MFKSAIKEVELDDGGKRDKTTDRGNLKTQKKSNLVELNRVWKQPHKCPGKKRYSYKQLL